jgi:2-(1,2-epoxy-1,2-dihydrophenyl)acetyl-CoA isomerase
MDWARKLAKQPGATLAKRALDFSTDLEAALELEIGHALITEYSAGAAKAAEVFRSRE